MVVTDHYPHHSIWRILGYLCSFPNYLITEGCLRQYLHPNEVPRVVPPLQDTTLPEGLPSLTLQCQEPGGDTRRSAVRHWYEIHNPFVRQYTGTYRGPTAPVYGGFPLLVTPPSLTWLKLVSSSWMMTTVIVLTVFPVPQTLNMILIILSCPQITPSSYTRVLNWNFLFIEFWVEQINCSLYLFFPGHKEPNRKVIVVTI